MIEFSDKDLLRGIIVTPAWYRCKIESIGESPSKDGNSTNYTVEATILGNADNGDTEFTGVPVIWNFNSKAIGLAADYLRAFGVEVKPKQRFELESSVGKEIDIFVENSTYEGRLKNKVNHKYRTAK